VLNDLRDAQWSLRTSLRDRDRHAASVRGEAEWPIWQMDGSWFNRSVRPVPDSYLDGRPARIQQSSPAVLSLAALVALFAVTAAVLAIGIGVGLW
jgi:hypothetical protein